MQISIIIDLSEEATKDDVVAAIRDAAERASGQIEHDILPFPLEVDESIALGSDVGAVEEASLFRCD